MLNERIMLNISNICKNEKLDKLLFLGGKYV